MGLGNGAMAAEWGELKGSLLQQILYNDNISLSYTGKQPVFGYILTPTLQASHTEELFDIDFSARGDIRRYDNSLWDCENYTLGLNSQYRAPRNVFMFTGGYGISCAYSQQTQEIGIAVPVAQATNYNLSPSWTWQWTEASKLSLGASYMNTSFSGGASSTTGTSSTSYTNYDSYTVNLNLNHAWDRNLVVNGGLAFVNTQYMGANASTQQSFGFQLGGQYLISQHWTAKFGGGLRWTDIQQNSAVTLSASNSVIMNPTGNIDVNYDGSLDHFSIGFSSILMPSSIGQTMQILKAYASYSYFFTPNLSLGTNSYIESRQLISGQSSIGAASYSRNYATASASLDWKLAKNWTIKGAYTYQWQKLLQQGVGGISDGNIVMLSLNYAWDGI